MIQRSGIFFHYIYSYFLFQNRNNLKIFINQLFQIEGRELQTVDYIFCTDKYLFKLNQKYLHHNTLTDIITFDLSETHQIVGEVYISIDRVKENAKLFNTTFTKELHRII